MEKCKTCKVKYPDELLWIGECGICALDRTNQMLGIDRKEFTGTSAEEMRQGAIQWRKDNQ